MVIKSLNMQITNRFFSSFFRNIIVLIAVLILSYMTASWLGQIYKYVFPSEFVGGLFSVPTQEATWIVGFPLDYILFLTGLFTIFGGKGKYWWIGILLIPAAVVEIYFDLPHIYFPVILGVIGWGIGYLISRFLSQGSLPPQSST